MLALVNRGCVYKLLLGRAGWAAVPGLSPGHLPCLAGWGLMCNRACLQDVK